MRASLRPATSTAPYKAHDARGGRVGAVLRSPTLTGVHITAGTTDVNSIVQANATGTSFWFDPVTYNMAAAIVPKTGQTFTGQIGTVINGSGTVDRAIKGNTGSGAGTGFTVRNIVFDNFTASTLGAVTVGTAGSLVEYCEVRNTTGTSPVGIWTSNAVTARYNYAHHNGKYGFSGNGDGINCLNNEIAYNNLVHGTLGYNDAGGAKWAAGTSNLLAQYNWVHHNGGGGLWVDADGYLVTIDSNRVWFNDFSGIIQEIGFDAVISNNDVRYNAVYYLDPANQTGSTGSIFYGADVIVNTSKNVEITGNTVVTTGNGIGLIGQSGRGSSTHSFTGLGGPATGTAYSLTGANVHANTVTVEGAGLKAAGHVDAGTSSLTDTTNRFASNTYHVPSGLTTGTWWIHGTAMNKAAWQAIPEDAAGTFLSP